MKKYKIYINGYEVGTISATPEEIRKYNAAGIVAIEA